MKYPEYTALCRQYLEAHKPVVAPASYQTMRNNLKAFGQWLKRTDAEVNRQTVLKWTCWMLKHGRKPNGCITLRHGVSSLFLWAHDNGLWSEENPVRKMPTLVPQPSKQVNITPEEYQRLMEWDGWPGIEWQTMVAVGWHTGLRLGDCANLRWDQINLEEAVLRIVPQKGKRYGKELEIPIDALVPSLRKLLPGPGRNQPLVFPEAAYSYTAFGHRVLSSRFIDMARACGVRKSFHCLRHGFCTKLIEKGVSLGVVRSMTGHSLAMLERYLHPSLESKREALAE